MSQPAPWGLDLVPGRQAVAPSRVLPRGQLVADDTRVGDDLTQPQLQVDLALEVAMTGVTAGPRAAGALGLPSQSGDTRPCVASTARPAARLGSQRVKEASSPPGTTLTAGTVSEERKGKGAGGSSVPNGPDGLLWAVFTHAPQAPGRRGQLCPGVSVLLRLRRAGSEASDLSPAP